MAELKIVNPDLDAGFEIYYWLKEHHPRVADTVIFKKDCIVVKIEDPALLFEMQLKWQ